MNIRQLFWLAATCTWLPATVCAQTELDPIVVIQPETEDPHSKDTSELGKDAKNATLGGYLDNMPNVDSASYGEAVGRPVVRGMSGYRIKILHNDNEVSDLSAMSQDHAVAVAPRASERIELLKGPASLLYAAQAGGVVRIRDVLDNPFLDSGLRSQIDTDLRPTPYSHAVDGRVTWSDDDWALHAGALHQDADPYEAGDGREIRDSDLSTQQAQLAVGWRPGPRSEWLLGTTRLRKDYGIPNDTPEATRIDMQRDDYSLRFRYDAKPQWLDSMSVDLNHSDYLHDETEGGRKDGLFGQKQDQGTLRWAWVTAAWSGDTRLSATQSELRVCHEHGACDSFSDAARTEAPLGESVLEYVDNTGLPYSHGHPMPDTQTRLVQLSHVAERSLDLPYTVSLGLHTQWRKLDPDPDNIQEQWVYPEELDPQHYNTRNETAWSASVGLRKEADGSAFGWETSLSTLQRLPSVDELYWNGFHHATDSYIFGNSELKKERSVNVDLDFTWESQAQLWQLSGFYYLFDDYIFQNQGYDADGAELTDPFHLSEVWFTRQTDARFLGGSVRYELRPASADTRPWLLWAQADILHAEQSGGQHLPRTAPANAELGVRYQSTLWTASLRLKRVFKAQHLAPNERPTAGYNWLAVYLERSWRWDDQRVDLWLKGENLLDVYAQNHLSVLKDTAPLPGRQLSAGVKWRFFTP